MGVGRTTIIRQVLEQRAEKASMRHVGATATLSVMARVLPRPKTLLVCQDSEVRRQIECRITDELLDVEVVTDASEALRRFAAELHPLIVTDSLEMVAELRARRDEISPFILYVAGLDDPAERKVGLTAGADECIGCCSSQEEMCARFSTARRIAELEAVLRITVAENRKLSATDELTQVASRRFFHKHFPREVERAGRLGRALSLILCDIDQFRKMNEKLGHPGGDQILQQFGQRLQEGARRGVDWVARIGGDEFVVVLPETAYEPALDVARNLRRSVSHSAFRVDGKSVKVTASFGLCGLDRVPVTQHRLAKRMLKIADTALYSSKHNGRNRVTATILRDASSDVATR
jgi:two-component system, cell cycle response regulator